MSVLIIDTEAKFEIENLIRLAEMSPVDVIALREALKGDHADEAKAAYRGQMTNQTISVKAEGLTITFSVETGVFQLAEGQAPLTRVRHLSVSTHGCTGLVPAHHLMWALADLFGFGPNRDAYEVWIEVCDCGCKAVNLVEGYTVH